MDMNIAPSRAKAGMRPVDEQAVLLMRREVCAQTDEALMRQFGISYNTWRKLIAGRPVRRSLAERVTDRVRHIAQIEGHQVR